MAVAARRAAASRLSCRRQSLPLALAASRVKTHARSALAMDERDRRYHENASEYFWNKVKVADGRE